MLRRHAPPSPPAARARELRAPHAPAPCTHTPRRVPGPAGLPRGATGVTGISGANIGFDLPHLKRASHPQTGASLAKACGLPGLRVWPKAFAMRRPACHAAMRMRSESESESECWRELALRGKLVIDSAKTGLEPTHSRLESEVLAVTQARGSA